MEEQGDSRRHQPRDRVAVAMAVASWFFAGLAFATLAFGLLGFVPHFPLMAFVWLGVAAFFRILKDERAPEPATGPPHP